MQTEGSPRPLILAINPSHAADTESSMWAQIAAAAATRGWQLVQVAARAIPGVEHAATEVFTARLWQYADRMGRRPTQELHTLPEWFDTADVERHTEWEHLRWELATFDTKVIDGAHRLAWFMEDLLAELRPAVVLTTNKIDHPCAMARAAALHHGIPTRLIERSPFDGIWLEPNGLFAESRLWEESKDVDFAPYREAGQDAMSSLVANPAGFRADEASADRPNLQGDGPLIFLPMDNLLWTGWGQAGHPQGITDNPLFSTPLEGVEAVAEWAARQGGRVAMKAHPSCAVTPTLTLPHNVDLVDGELSYFIDRADLTVTFNTKLAFLAAAQQKRLAVLADNPAAVVPGVPFWRRSGSVQSLLDTALEAEPPDAADVAAVFGWMESEHFYTIEPGPRGPQKMVEDLIDLAPAASGSTMSDADVARLSDRSKGVPDSTAEAADRPRRLIIDVSRMVDPRGHHSGIGRYCREIIDHLQRNSPAETWALIREPARGWPASAQRLHFDLRRRVDGRVLTVKHGMNEEVIGRKLGRLGRHDVFHSTHLGLPDQAMLGEANRVITIHDVLHLKYPDLYDGPKPPTIKRILDTLDSDDDWVITVSDQTRRDLLSIHPRTADRMRVIPLGVALPAGSDDRTPRDGFIFSMLQSEPRKNLANTVAAIGKALRMLDDTDTEVVFAVNSQTLKQAMAECDKAGLAGRVRYAISPTDHELSDLFSSAGLYVFGSIYEGFGLPPLEAMSFGAPTVAVMASSMLEVLGDAVAYATSGSADDLATAIVAAMRSPQLRAELSERASARARSFSWERTASRHLDLYSEAAEVGKI